MATELESLANRIEGRIAASEADASEDRKAMLEKLDKLVDKVSAIEASTASTKTALDAHMVHDDTRFGHISRSGVEAMNWARVLLTILASAATALLVAVLAAKVA